jgi:hypothetical protein
MKKIAAFNPTMERACLPLTSLPHQTRNVTLSRRANVPSPLQPILLQELQQDDGPSFPSIENIVDDGDIHLRQMPLTNSCVCNWFLAVTQGLRVRVPILVTGGGFSPFWTYIPPPTKTLVSSRVDSYFLFSL